MNFFGFLALGVAIGLPIAVIGGGLGQGRAAAAALEGMARQPEAIGRIQTGMILALAFIESLVIFTFVFLFLLNGKIPTLTAEQAMQIAGVENARTSAPANP